MPSDRRPGRVFSNQDLLQTRQRETGCGLYLPADFEQEFRNRLRRQRLLLFEIVTPPERYNPPLTLEAMKLKLPKRKGRGLREKTALILRGNHFRLIRESIRKRLGVEQ